MSDTPRTDAVWFDATVTEAHTDLNTLTQRTEPCVFREFARQLEREVESLREWQQKIRADYVCPDCAVRQATERPITDGRVCHACDGTGKVVDVQILDNHDCVDAYGECRGGAQQITLEVLQQQSRLAALRDVREKIDSLTLDEEYAGHYHQGFGMAVSQSLVAIDGLINAVLQPNRQP